VSWRLACDGVPRFSCANFLGRIVTNPTTTAKRQVPARQRGFGATPLRVVVRQKKTFIENRSGTDGRYAHDATRKFAV
jgi:hypothetical protein